MFELYDLRDGCSTEKTTNFSLSVSRLNILSLNFVYWDFRLSLVMAVFILPSWSTYISSVICCLFSRFYRKCSGFLTGRRLMVEKPSKLTKFCRKHDHFFGLFVNHWLFTVKYSSTEAEKTLPCCIHSFFALICSLMASIKFNLG